MDELESRMFEANKRSLETLKHMREMEVERATLQHTIMDLKEKAAVYIPAKDDAIDLKMADYINNYPDREQLKVMFLRESEGTYQFGSKRVHIKVENNKILIRTGGGYLGIDEFVD
mmetsp:Transcript_19639/g.26556  ORF Transcript_19639/g.26556 Transcript_19639/m.26556 type:complete len:116 (+) Transcript_19639:899-1246(+)|eukprot:CAMPEP_0185585156 /NCGR_PEP_ID=MMETSP0434-20130131/36928_1 /TAXON_ID=626734 ORGANISM="Favella taraikaensis, Strain Fe Narragansett Bay" /NCGR_SAMPLE_ID=MMETSP0434 /ASSEMBLY_ACC=CAM_ASM_000379 /LENGTH=115 /DNA_ID=CAMNT_0028205319 /DNA_START=860 /DNA_END=1207 /DNA_ORIENTATION=-